jgi:WD40 repeat protein
MDSLGTANSLIASALSQCYAQVKIWSVRTGKVMRTLFHPAPSENKKYARVSFSPDGSRLAASGGMGWLLVFDLGTDQVALTCEGFKGDARDLAFSPDGRWIAVASWAGNPSQFKLLLFDARSGQAVAQSLPAPDWPRDHELRVVEAVAFSPDSQRLASTDTPFPEGDSIIRIWDMTTMLPRR